MCEVSSWRKTNMCVALVLLLLLLKVRGGFLLLLLLKVL
jgi:hypothetical protein